ncbi:MAG: AEC family transporter [Desulfovibrionaceae bacterium]|nr:AEC family transporter [Desulfovibrionaceae bacterium]
MDFLQALGGVLSLLSVSLVGVVLDRCGWIGAETRRLVPRIVTCIALPPYLFHSILTTLGHEDLRHFLTGSLIPCISIVATFAVSILVGRLCRVERRHFGLFCTTFSTSSAVFVGIPLCGALLGAKAIPFALLYYFANAAFFWTIGCFCIAWDARDSERQRSFSLQRALRSLLSPPLLGFAAGLAAVLLSIEPPAFIMASCAIIGQMTTPLALLYIGFSLSLAVSSRYFSRDLIIAACGRLLVCPAVTALVVLLFRPDPLVGQTFVLQAALPAVLQAAILSAHHKTDPEFGSLIITMTTICCVVTIPIVMSLF